MLVDVDLYIFTQIDMLGAGRVPVWAVTALSVHGPLSTMTVCWRTAVVMGQGGGTGRAVQKGDA